MLKQISVFMQNKPGALAKFTKTLMDQQINIRAVTVSETADYGIMRMIVDKSDEAIEVLKRKNYIVSVTDVIAVDLPDKTEALYEVAQILGDNNINIEYIYSSSYLKEENIIILRVDDNNKTIKILKEKGFNLIESQEF